ncbi:hypothetical protein [Sinosporangium siamense]|uniref:hypothetical protein n=1 Tax=Sinosporangium siamense TaxID=1367973 RepID=UPI00194F8B5F|nr:hypothetical protein [Sinosporangium siamense]
MSSVRVQLEVADRGIVYLADRELEGYAAETPAQSIGIIAVEQGYATLRITHQWGPANFTVAISDRAPEADLTGYEDIVEIGYQSMSGHLEMTGFCYDEHIAFPLPPLPAGPGEYRIRYHVKGMDTEGTEDATDDHYLQIWPSPPRDPVVVQTTTQTLHYFLAPEKHEGNSGTTRRNDHGRPAMRSALQREWRLRRNPGTDWSDVRERLVRLTADPGADAVFGSACHRWTLQPPLGAGDLAQIEAQLRTELPGEYQSFLQQAGAGGAGPAYGLFPVRRVNGRWQWEGDGANLTDLGTLNQPFPHVEAFNPADALPAPPDEEDFDSSEAFTAAEDAYWEQYNTIVYDHRHSIGLLYLCHLGCALREALVISGPARGQMWGDDTAGGAGFQPLVDDAGNPLGFARWYRRWLDAAEDQASHEAH